MGEKFNKLKGFNIRGTTASVADQPLLEKPVNPWSSDHVFPVDFLQEGVYFEDTMREGSQFRTAEATFRATGATTNIKLLKINTAYCIIAYSYASKAYVRVGIRSGATYSWGTEALVNNAVTSGIDLCKINETTFAISYLDDGGADYHCARIGTFDSVGAVTLGTEKELTGALAKTGTSVCMPRAGVLAFASSLVGDGKLDIFASLFTGTTIATAGTPVEFGGGASSLPSIESQTNGEIIVVFQAGYVANDPITYSTGTVSAANVVAVVTAETTMAGTAAAATSIKVLKVNDNKVLVGWIDSTFAKVRAATLASGVITLGDQVVLTSSASLTFDFAMLDENRFIGVYEDDGDSDYGKCIRFDLSGVTITAGEGDVFALTATANTAVCAFDSNVYLSAFMDDAASDIGRAILGTIEKNLIDIRSDVASVSFSGWFLSLERAGMGILAIYEIAGTTHASANTAMSTLPTLPWNKHPGVMMLFKEKGMYLEYDGSVAPYASGVAISTRSIDVRSSETSEAFSAYALKWNSSLKTLAHS